MNYIKRDRNFYLAIQGQSGNTIIIPNEFTIEFDITRNILSSANHSVIKIYNLGYETRNDIRYDITNYSLKRSVLLKAGYGQNMPVIFAGNITKASSQRQRDTFITTIECFDGGFALVNGFFNGQYKEGTPIKTIVEDMVKNLPGVTEGYVTSGIQGETKRATSLTGNTGELLNQYVRNMFFIDNEKAYVLKDNECRKGEIEEVDSSQILNTPELENTLINFDMLFEPRLLVNQKLKLNSRTTAKQFNKEWKLVGLKHRAMISPVVSGEAVTSVSLLAELSKLVTVGG